MCTGKYMCVRRHYWLKNDPYASLCWMRASLQNVPKAGRPGTHRTWKLDARRGSWDKAMIIIAVSLTFSLTWCDKPQIRCGKLSQNANFNRNVKTISCRADAKSSNTTVRCSTGKETAAAKMVALLLAKASFSKGQKSPLANSNDLIPRIGHVRCASLRPAVRPRRR